jgi:hypothetical protein
MVPFSSYKRAEKHITPQQTDINQASIPHISCSENNLHVIREQQFRHQELATVLLNSFGCFLTHVPLP